MLQTYKPGKTHWTEELYIDKVTNHHDPDQANCFTTLNRNCQILLQRTIQNETVPHSERNNKCCKEAPSTVAKQVRHFWKDFSTTCTTCHQNFQHSVNSNYSITSQQHGSLPRCQTMLWSFPQLSTEYWATFGVWHCIFTSYSHHT